MSENGTIFRKGTVGVQFHPVPFLLLKTPPHNNILIGDDAIQIRFMEQLTGLKTETQERVHDEDLFGKDGVLIRILTGNTLDLSPQLRAKTGVWALVPITSGSVSANAMVRAAAETLKVKVKKEDFDAMSRHVGKLFERGDLSDLRVGLWETVYAMTGNLSPTRWREPWETSLVHEWMPPGVDLELRFGFLAKILRAYVLMKTGAEADVKKMGLSPSKMLKLKELAINPERVQDAIQVLSRWKQFGTDPRIVALHLTKVWHS